MRAFEAIPAALAAPNNVRLLLEEIEWLVQNSEGVVGLTFDGSVLPWRQVIQNYLPLVNHQEKIVWTS